MTEPKLCMYGPLKKYLYKKLIFIWTIQQDKSRNGSVMVNRQFVEITGTKVAVII